MSTYQQRLDKNKRRYPFNRWRLMQLVGMFQYTRRNCHAAREVFDKLLAGLLEIGEGAPEAQKMALFEAAVIALNQLNAATKHSLIETGQREDLWKLFNEIAVTAGIDCSKYQYNDFTFQWREW